MSSKICFIHTETTGLHEFKDEKVYKKNLFGFARLVSFSWIVAQRTDNDNFTIIKTQKHIIKPRCLHIPDEIVKFHGITQEIALAKGVEIEDVLTSFKNDLVGVNVIVSHSLDFHLKTVQAELVRYNKAIDFNKYILHELNSFDTKVSSPTIRNLSKNILNREINNKSEIVEAICQMFFKLYDKYEKSILLTT